MTEKEVLKIIEEAAKDGRTQLGLSFMGIKSLPGEIGKLSNLEFLAIAGNQLTSVPVELGKLTNLTMLLLHKNQFGSVPAELGKLTKLTVLDVSRNQLTSVPAELGNLTELTELDLRDNELTRVPTELGKLTKLTALHLWNNQLASVPAQLGKLTNLTALNLNGNRLTSVPGELGKLTKLKILNLERNQLTRLPAELGELTNLFALYLGDNPFESPPPEVLGQGQQAVLAYLRAQLEEKKRQWVSKLLVVGEGGVGKTSLLRALRGEEFVEGLETTHGIGVEKLELSHPSEAGVTMELNTWDFGGQQIYHATHQFFLTNRSLFVLVWDARHGWEAGKLYDWLDRIKAKAPESPVMIVATHIDERAADLPLDDLQRKYSQIQGHYKVSNKAGTGIAEFKENLAQTAAGLALMGEEWPASWLDAANEIRGRQESYITPKKLRELMGKHKVSGNSAGVLARWLHELGDILWFEEDEELNDLVILNPQWVTEAISAVLESDEVIKKAGVLTRAHRDELWGEFEESVREHLLRLMERFDLSYRTLENREISLVVERLPLDPPDYRQKWEAIKKKQGCKEISMKFELSSVPAGIPTWFIARSHRFTTRTHWRNGALFADSPEHRHLGLIEAYPHERYLRLTVRGPAPHNFFVLLRDGLELTLARFPGLEPKRTVPCPGHDGGTCAHEFDFGQLQKAIERDKPVMKIQCSEAFEYVLVSDLLFGLHWKTEDEVIKRVDDLESEIIRDLGVILTEEIKTRDELKAEHRKIMDDLSDHAALLHRGFTVLFNAQQRLEESHCPNVFAVLPESEKRWRDKILGQRMVMQLYCQAPGHWHPAVEGKQCGRYEIKRPSEFFGSMGPYILGLAKVIRYAAPVAGAAAGMAAAGIGGAVIGAEAAKRIAAEIKLMEELAKKLAGSDYLEADLLERTKIGGKAGRVEGAQLRALRILLDEVDKAHEWGGLRKVLTPEGHYLWLCEHHAQEYAN